MTHKKYEKDINKDLDEYKKKEPSKYEKGETYLKTARDKIHKLRNR